jgi:hypothetical protein
VLLPAIRVLDPALLVRLNGRLRIFLTIVLFFTTAALIHGASHLGRLGPTDSFNRVAFHIVPVIVWYTGVVLKRILGAKSADEGCELRKEPKVPEADWPGDCSRV